MNETFHIPVSDPEDNFEDSGTGAENTSENGVTWNDLAEESIGSKENWDELSEEFSEDEFMKRTQEIAERNTFDFPEIKLGKTEEERRYEARERDLIGELEHVSEKNARDLFNIGEEFRDTLRSFESPKAGKVGETFDYLSGASRNGNQRKVEALVAFIDEKYPSPYKEKEDRGVLSPFEPDESEEKLRKLEDKKDEYRRNTLNYGGTVADVTEDLSKLFTIDGNQNDYYIGNTIRNLGSGSAEIENALTNAVIDYAEDPSEENRQKLRRVQTERENMFSNSMFNIAGAFDESRTRVGQKLFEPTVALATLFVKNNEDYFDGIMKYLDFKIQNSSRDELASDNSSTFDESRRVEESPKNFEDLPEKDDSSDNKILPDVVLF